MISGTVFGFLFLVVGLLMRSFLGIASLRNKAFKKRLRENNYTMLVKTRDGKKARHYRLEGGKLKSRGTDFPNPDLSLVWSDSRSFFKTIFKLNPLVLAKGLNEALAEGILTIEANIGTTTWFASEMVDMLGVYRSFFSRAKTV